MSVAARADRLLQFLDAALAEGLPEGDLAALRSLARLDRVAADPTAAWYLAVRRVVGQPVAEAAALLGGALVFASVGEGPPWRSVHPLGQLVEARWFAPGEDGVQTLRLRLGDAAHVLEEKPGDAFGTGLRAFSDAILERLQAEVVR